MQRQKADASDGVSRHERENRKIYLNTQACDGLTTPVNWWKR
jgi:hypothetical protein